MSKLVQVEMFRHVPTGLAAAGASRSDRSCLRARTKRRRKLASAVARGLASQIPSA